MWGLPAAGLTVTGTVIVTEVVRGLENVMVEVAVDGNAACQQGQLALHIRTGKNGVYGWGYLVVMHVAGDCMLLSLLLALHFRTGTNGVHRWSYWWGFR